MSRALGLALMVSTLPSCIYLGDDPTPNLEVGEETRLELGELAASADDFDAFAAGETARCDLGLQGGYVMRVSALLSGVEGLNARRCPDGLCDEREELQIVLRLGDADAEYAEGWGSVQWPLQLTERGAFAEVAVLAFGYDRFDNGEWVRIEDGEIVPVLAIVTDAFGTSSTTRIEVALDLPDLF